MNADAKKQGFWQNMLDMGLEAVSKYRLPIMMGACLLIDGVMIATGYGDYAWAAGWRAGVGMLTGTLLGLGATKALIESELLNDGDDEDCAFEHSVAQRALLAGGIMVGSIAGAAQGIHVCNNERNGFEKNWIWEDNVPKKEITSVPTEPVLGPREIAYSTPRLTA